MPDQPVDDRGRFALKGDEPRRVRSVRLSDTAYSALTQRASKAGLSLGDYLESFALSEPPSRGRETPLREIELLTQALSLPANRGGAIKSAIREALQTLSPPT